MHVRESKSRVNAAEANSIAVELQPSTCVLILYSVCEDPCDFKERQEQYKLYSTLMSAIPVLVALKILRDILSFTRSFMINTGSPARWVSQKLRPKCKTIPCYTADCFKSSCLLFVDTMCLALQRDSRFVLQNCHATDIALRILKKLWCYVGGSITR